MTALPDTAIGVPLPSRPVDDLSTEPARAIRSDFLLGQLLRKAHLSASIAILDGSRPLGLELRHVAAIVELAVHNALSQSQLVSASGMDKATLVRVLDDLEENDLAERRPHPTDRRTHLVSLTPRGENTAEQLRLHARHVSDRLTNGMSPAHVAQLIELLSELGAHAADRNH